MENIDSFSDEIEALQELHFHLSESDCDQQKRLLLHGYIPGSTKALIESGIKCILYIDFNTAASDEPTQSAISRLTTIITKLKILSNNDKDAKKAIIHFDEIISKFRKKEADNTFFGLMLILGGITLIAIIGFLIWYFITT